jgi:catechol 2,3-dioxygenase-like lactoylglutathione lyase family enzyme
MLSRFSERGKRMFTNAKAEPVVPVSDLDRAASFYGETLGLSEVQRYEEPAANPMIRYAIGGSTLLLYKSVGAGESRHTLVGFIVDDIDATVEELRGRGVTFEEYDMGDIKTENGIATIGGDRAAWFKDPDGNILGVGQYG